MVDYNEMPTQTEWNGGTLTNIRIHDIRGELKVVTMQKDIENWVALLIKLNHELYPFQNKEEKVIIRKRLDELSIEVNDIMTIRQRNKRIGIPIDMILKLHDIEYVLDEVFNKSGLQTALKDDPGDSF